MRTKTQQFGRATKPEERVTIETPVGFIIINGRDIKVELPAFLRAHKGPLRAYENARWLQVDGEHIRPLYSVLSPVLDSDGSMIGIKKPNEFVVACAAGGDAENDDET